MGQTQQVKITTEYLAERDGPECVWCGRKMWSQDWSIEHLCPRNRGGHKTEENALLACRICNSARKSQSAVAFARQQELSGYQPRWELLRKALSNLSVSERKAHQKYGLSQLRHLG